LTYDNAHVHHSVENLIRESTDQDLRKTQ